MKDLITFDKDLDVNTPFARFNFVHGTAPGAQIAAENPDEGLTPLAVASRSPELDNAKLLIKKGKMLRILYSIANHKRRSENNIFKITNKYYGEDNRQEFQ